MLCSPTGEWGGACVVRRLSWVMAVIPESFYHLYFPEQTIEMLHYQTINSFLQAVPVIVCKNTLVSHCMQCYANGHYNVMHISNGDALKCSLGKKNKSVYDVPRQRKDAPLLSEVYKQSEVLPWKQINTYSERDLWMQAVTGCVPDSTHSAWVGIK